MFGSNVREVVSFTFRTLYAIPELSQVETRKIRDVWIQNDRYKTFSILRPTDRAAPELRCMGTPMSLASVRRPLGVHMDDEKWDFEGPETRTVGCIDDG